MSSHKVEKTTCGKKTDKSKCKYKSKLTDNSKEMIKKTKNKEKYLKKY